MDRPVADHQRGRHLRQPPGAPRHDRPVAQHLRRRRGRARRGDLRLRVLRRRGGLPPLLPRDRLRGQHAVGLRRLRRGDLGERGHRHRHLRRLREPRRARGHHPHRHRRADAERHHLRRHAHRYRRLPQRLRDGRGLHRAPRRHRLMARRPRGHDLRCHPRARGLHDPLLHGGQHRVLLPPRPLLPRDGDQRGAAVPRLRARQDRGQRGRVGAVRDFLRRPPRPRLRHRAPGVRGSRRGHVARARRRRPLPRRASGRVEHGNRRHSGRPHRVGNHRDAGASGRAIRRQLLSNGQGQGVHCPPQRQRLQRHDVRFADHHVQPHVLHQRRHLHLHGARVRARDPRDARRRWRRRSRRQRQLLIL